MFDGRCAIDQRFRGFFLIHRRRYMVREVERKPIKEKVQGGVKKDMSLNQNPLLVFVREKIRDDQTSSSTLTFLYFLRAGLHLPTRLQSALSLMFILRREGVGGKDTVCISLVERRGREEQSSLFCEYF